MSLNALLNKARVAAGPNIWGAAVKLARDGAVKGLSSDGDEICLSVKSRGRALPQEVFLWPEDEDWGCDCGIKGPCCVHVCAAIISMGQTVASGEALPTPQKAYRVKLHYALQSQGTGLSVERVIVWPDGRNEPLTTTLAESSLLVGRGDTQVESLLAMHTGGVLPADLIRRFLVFLEGEALATLDGKPVQLSTQPVSFRVVVRDEGEDFRVGLYRPKGVDVLYRGAALMSGVLHPTSHGTLSADQRRELMRGVVVPSTDVSRLVNVMLPKLRGQLPVDVESDRLPRGEHLKPVVSLAMEEVPQGLRVEASVVYGNPPVARVRRGVLKALGKVVPARDMGQERVVARQFEKIMGIVVGVPVVMPPGKAAAFLGKDLQRFRGPTEGQVRKDRFRIVEHTLEPDISVRPATEEDGHAGWGFDVGFGVGALRADPGAVLAAWRSGRSLVPLLEGGFAPLPLDWLERHGRVLRELLEARDAKGRVDRFATAALVDLLEGVELDVPPELTRLSAFLTQGEGLPEVEMPAGFTGELRPYQKVGYDWLCFLKTMELHGILADDMGLGKTVQALSVMTSTEGPSLVVAPTSVLRNWERESNRFFPDQTVNVYHGMNRKLQDVDLTLTSYALLRLDIDQLNEVNWSYVVLDEAQMIKNPQSQTAQAAYRIQARHRLTLTGTPVENRLDELWSQFRFLMPGLLGSRSSFRDGFSRPIEVGEMEASQRLRRRIRPYVLRRLKQQVEPELPLLTEMLIRCDMDEAQRRVYEAVRIAAHRDVMTLLAEGGSQRGRSIQVLEALLRMRQACCDPALLPGDAGAGAGSCKLDRLEELLVEILCAGHKALIFSQWTGLLDRVELRLKSLDVEWTRLDGATRNRQDVIDRFQSPDGPAVFLLSLKAGGTGLNLTAADYVILLDPWWNPAVEKQATDRAYRIGQDKPVVSCRFVASSTIEERIIELQAAKRDLADSVLGGAGGFIRHLSANELRELFEPSQ